MRFKLLLLLFLYVGLARAEWTGVALEIADYDSDWKFDHEVREARMTSFSFQIEEKFKTGLSAGGGIGYFDVRVDGGDDAETEKFDGQYLELYLRQPLRISENILLHGLLSYRYNSGDNSGGGERADISWSEVGLLFGAGLRFSHFRITPFVAYYSIDGDMDDDVGTSSFENDESISQGISFDYIVEETGYIRVEIRSGYQEGGYLSFGQRY